MDLHQQLRTVLGAEAVITDAARIEPLLCDHRGLFRGRATAIVEPPDTAAVSRLLGWCNEQRIPVVPQGGNTGYCGGATPDSTGNAILVLMGRMNRIRSVDAANFAMVAEAGCTLAAVHDAAAAAQRRFPLRLGSEGTCQIGGNLATNAGGTAVLRYGMMRDLALGIEAVLADGSVVSQLSPLRKDNTGYNLCQLLIGSEGTLGIITAACLKLFPQAGGVATAWIALPSPAAGVSLLALLREHCADSLESCELVPREALRLVVEHIPGARHPGTDDAPWNLLVEITGGSDNAAAESLGTALAHALETGLALEVTLAGNEAQRFELWRLRESVPEAQRRAGGSLKHDISVPVAALPDFIVAGSALVAGQVPEGFLVAYGHLGDGNLHFNVNQLAGTDSHAFRGREPALKRAIHELVADFGGSFSAEHGIGQLKTGELERYAAPAELAAMRRIKQALDPNNILNPGKVLRSTTP